MITWWFLFSRRNRRAALLYPHHSNTWIPLPIPEVYSVVSNVCNGLVDSLLKVKRLMVFFRKHRFELKKATLSNDQLA